MSQDIAIVIGQLIGVKTSDDGTHVLIGTVGEGGAVLNFAVGRDQALPLADLLALGNTQCRKIANVPSEHRETFTTTWWEIGTDQTTKNVILSLIFGAGGRLDFTLPAPMPSQMLETLQSVLGLPTAQRPEGLLN